MAEIRIIPSIRLYKSGAKVKQANGSVQRLDLFRQGTLDGACAVYSTLISLMSMREINYSQVDPRTGNIDKRSPQGKFLSTLLEQRGMNLAGWNLKTLASEINNGEFNHKATAIKKDYIDRIYQAINDDLPVIIGLDWKTGEKGHAVVCVGFEESEEYEDTPQKLFCIDPYDNMPTTGYWNGVLHMPNGTGDEVDFNYATESEYRNVKIFDTIIFEEID